MKSFECVICKMTFEGWSNNAEPLASGECCDSCNIRVLMARLNGGA